ncbi:MAG: hypothetical protein ACREXU_04405 [Gammaproteobacteria bacterium]
MRVSYAWLAAMGIPTASLAPAAVAAAVFLVNVLVKVGIDAVCEAAPQDRIPRRHRRNPRSVRRAHDGARQGDRPVPAELNLRFPDPEHVAVSCDGEESGTLPFASPLTPKDRQDLRWYLEVYGAHSLGDPDDIDARRIAAQLAVWGKRLFEAVFGERAPERIFNRFQDIEDGTRLLTVSAEHPAILALPWELLHDPSTGGVFLFTERPRISIRRRVAGEVGGRKRFKVRSKDRLHQALRAARPAPGHRRGARDRRTRRGRSYPYHRVRINHQAGRALASRGSRNGSPWAARRGDRGTG